MNVSFHIDFDGRCKQAFDFYTEHLNAKLGFMRLVKDSPLSTQIPEIRQNDVVHANIEISGVSVSGADVATEEYKKPSGFYILLGVKTPDEVQSMFDVLKLNGTTIIEPQKTFWSSCYSIVVDQFGVPWKVNCSA